VTTGPEDVPKAGEHPDPGLIAAHAERRLSGAEAARMDEHLAGCTTCHEVFAETLRFALDEEAAGVLPRRALTAIPFMKRPAFRLAAVLAIAATVVLAFQKLWLARLKPASPSLVAELAEAMGTTRFIEPRLSGFKHGRLVILRSADRPQGLDAHTPAVLTAVARIRERAGADTSPESLGALAVTYLVSGDIGKAVKALESATAQDPKNPRLQSDLAAAYLVRASRLDEPADIPKALEAAETAIEHEDAPPEAWFNRALALEQLHLVDSAKKAWEDFLKRDSTSPWADEARKHLEDLPPAQQSTIEEDRARARAALAEGAAAIDRLADESPSILADYFLSELLPSWADAQLTGHPNALIFRRQAQQIGEALFRATGDALPRDSALAMVSSPSAASRNPLHSQALGYKALQEGQRLYDLKEKYPCQAFGEARRRLEEGASPYAAWARERVVVACLYPAEPREGQSELRGIAVLAATRGYRRLLGRAQWMEALFHVNQGELTASLDSYRRAHDEFRALRDGENEARVLARLSQVLQAAGEHRLAWREQLRALALLDQVREPERRYSQLATVALGFRYQQLTRAALHLYEALVVTARSGSIPVQLSAALLWRSLSLHDLASDDRAIEDLTEARRLIPQIGDPALTEALAAQADVVEAQVLTTRAPERAAAALERALGSYERTTPVWVPGLRLLLARAQVARGLDDAAEAELEAGIQMIEAQRASLRGDALQISFFDQGASLFDEMVALQIDKRHDPQRALWFVERSRARQLVDSLGEVAESAASRPTSTATNLTSPLNPEQLRRQLPENVALVYFMSAPERLLVWVLTRQGTQLIERSLPQDTLRRQVAAYGAAIGQRASLSVATKEAALLFDELLRPVLPAVRSKSTLILIPDEVLQRVPFAGLWDQQAARYLVEDHLVALAPSGTVFVRLSAAALSPKRSRDLRLLAIGNPHIAAIESGGLPSLPGAEAEAGEVAKLYRRPEVLTGDAATKNAFLSRIRHSEVIHFAGHAELGDVPGASARLLLAPDPETGASGSLYGHEFAHGALSQTQVVVLAGCQTTQGETSRLEGSLGIARLFLAGGVPMVVASIWDIDDAVSRQFSMAFHRNLLAHRDAAVALQHTQVAFLRDAKPSFAHPAAWAGFVVLGGLDHRKVASSIRSAGSV
jgi:CHAT domain-containing protein/tetratricopeptide (TPR) repeat protein